MSKFTDRQKSLAYGVNKTLLQLIPEMLQHYYRVFSLITTQYDSNQGFNGSSAYNRLKICTST